MRKLWIFGLLLLVVATTGCYWQDSVGTSQVGVSLNGGKIEKCVGPGVHTDMSFYADLVEVSTGTVTFPVEDPEVLTSDNQPVGVRITVQARRKGDCPSITNILSNWPTLVSDEALMATITATAREGIKIGTRGFTLAQLLNDRNGLADAIREQLDLDLGEYSSEAINVTIENIAPSPEYVQLLQEKANYSAAVDAEAKRQDLIRQQASNAQLEQQQRTATLDEQLKAEQAQTNIEVEQARRKGLVTKESQEIYSNNPQAYELKRLELMSQIFGDKSVFWMLPQGTDPTMLLNVGAGTAVPLPTGVVSP